MDMPMMEEMEEMMKMMSEMQKKMQGIMAKMGMGKSEIKMSHAMDNAMEE